MRTKLILVAALLGCGTDELGPDDLRPCRNGNQCDELCAPDRSNPTDETCAAHNDIGVPQSDGSEPRITSGECQMVDTIEGRRGCCVGGGAFSPSGVQEFRFFECEAQ